MSRNYRNEEEMPFLIGQALTGRDVEQETSRWPPERFASMCDALAWAESGRKAPRLPSFTSRVNDSDGGIDSQWDITLPEDVSSLPTPIIGPGWNVFQYKKRDLIARGRSQIVSRLNSVLTGAIGDIYKHSGRTPDRYVLFVNVDLSHDQKERVREAILKGSHQDRYTHVEIIGAGELGAFLNNHPHLRTAFFMTAPFKTWQEAYKAHEIHKILGAAVKLTGREDEKAKVQALIEDRTVRIVVLTGPHDIGKTRLVLEAARDRLHHVVVALDPRSMGISDYMALASPRNETICIVEDPDSASLERLLSEALSISNLKLIVTLPSLSFTPGLIYGLDKRIEVIRLNPLDEKASHDLLRASGMPLDFGIAEWIISHAKGFPGILLASASLGTELRREPGDFLSNVGKEFEKRINSELGSEVLKAAKLFSILTHVGISGDWEDEIKRVCGLFGDGLLPGEAVRALAMLEEAGIAKRAGSFAEITISILGNYLARQALLTGRDRMFALYGYLSDSGRERFIRRLSEVRGPEVEEFWEAFFSNDGPFGQFKAAVQRPRLLPIVAGAVPLRFLSLLESGLVPLNREQRLSLEGEERREIMWALEQVLFRADTSRRALRLIWLLAEAENETFGNNASAVLKECFHPLHSQMPLPLNERLEALKEFISENAPREGRIVAIEAAGEALRTRSHLLRQGIGVQPLDRRPTFTYEDLNLYIRNLIDLMFGLADDNDAEVAKTALTVLPDLIAEYGSVGRAKDTVEEVRLLADLALKRRQGLQVSSVFDTIHYVLDALSRRIETGRKLNETPDELKSSISELEKIKTRLEQESYDLRLKRWAGGWSIEDGEDIEINGKEVPRFEIEIDHLAREAAENPELLYPLISWLASDSAQKSHLFFYSLGGHDKGRVFREAIELVGRTTNGIEAFSAYFGGWGRHDPDGAESRIETLSSSAEYPAEALIRAISHIKARGSAVKRVLKLIEEGRISRFDTGRLLAGHWTRDLDLDQFRGLLKAVAGDDFQCASGALILLFRYNAKEWTQDHSLTEIAWRCLETAHEIKPYLKEWDLDRLAAKLARKDPKRGINLFESLLFKSHSHGSWNPITMHPKHRFWDVLYEEDKEALFEMLFNASLKDAFVRFDVTSQLRELLDLKKETDILISYAKRDEAIAEMISESISISQQGFWHIIEKVIPLYPRNEQITRYLLGAIMLENEGGFGLPSGQYQESKALVESRIHDPNTSPEVCAFLRKAKEYLQQVITHDVVWEYDIDIAGMKRHIEDRTSPDRIWAIGRVLKYGGPEDWRKLLNVEDIEEALPQIDLPEQKRKIIERALPYWRNHV
jgi:hypothetical protein